MKPDPAVFTLQATGFGFDGESMWWSVDLSEDSALRWTSSLMTEGEGVKSLADDIRDAVTTCFEPQP